MAGSAAVYATNRIERCFRDVHMVTQHDVVGPAGYTQAGRCFLGINTNLRYGRDAAPVQRCGYGFCIAEPVIRNSNVISGIIRKVEQFTTEDSHIALLREAGLRSTPQRLAIVREVFLRNHPTVAEVYDTVRRMFPTIGLATVYNTLRSLTERGYLRELPFGDATRFDVNVEPHTNLVCTRCGRIEDSSVCDDLIWEIRNRVAAGAGFQPEAQRIDVYGLCSRCAAA